MIRTEDWGCLPYREAWDRQKTVFQNLIADPAADEIIAVVEHPPVYTLGFHGNENNLIASEERLLALGAECIRIERGGDITYHGPGQLVVYPLLNLRNHRLGVKKYIELLEQSVVELLGEYGITAGSNDNQIGVWLDWGKPEARKICAIGVKISHGATMHGLALNVNTDLSAFGLINPCGITDKGVTSMAREIGRDLDFGQVRKDLSRILLRRIQNS